jgi:hypothetical protein
VDSLGNEGMPSGNYCVTTTGATSSVSVTLPNPSIVATSAVTYHVYRTDGGQVENDVLLSAAHTKYYTNTLASPFVDTGAAGTAGTPTQMKLRPDVVGGTAFLNPVGDSYLGMAGCVAFGKQTCSSAAREICRRQELSRVRMFRV